MDRFSHFSLLAAFVVFAPAAPADEAEQANDVKNTLLIVLDEKEFRSQFNKRAKAKEQMVDFAAASIGQAGLRFSAIYKPVASHPWKTQTVLSREAFLNRVKLEAGEKYRIVGLSAFSEPGREDQFTGIFVRDQGPAVELRVPLTEGEFRTEHNKLTESGHQLLGICAYANQGRARYGGLWEEVELGDEIEREADLDLNARAIRRAIPARVKEGFRLVQVEGLGLARRETYACLWEKSKGPKWEVRVKLSQAALQRVNKQLAAKGFHPVAVNAYNYRGSDWYCAIWEKAPGESGEGSP